MILLKVEKFGTGFIDKNMETKGDFFVFPAFTDSHIHMRALIASQYIVSIDDENLIDELESSKNDIVIGRGWKKDFDPKILEEIERPCIAVRICGHKAYCNEKFKKEFGLPSNVVTENDLVDLFVRLDELMLTEKYLKIAENRLKKMGIYRIIDMGSTPKLAEILKKGELSYNLFFDLPYKDFVLKTGLKFGDKLNGNTKILGIKIYLDGSLGTRTAAMGNNKKNLNYTDSELFKIMKEIDERNLAIAAHSIGDAAVHQFVSVFKNAKNTFHKIEHCQLVREEDVDKLMNPGIQPYFYMSDRLWAREIENKSLFYPLKSLMKKKPLGGSDFPVEGFNVIRSIKTAVLRVDGEGIDIKSAVDMYTKNADSYLGETLDKQILIEDFYSDSPKILGEIKI